MKGSIRLGRFLGVEVFLHFTFLILLTLVGAAEWLQSGDLGATVDGVLFVSMIFGCILLHELGHATAAMQFGIRTRDITLLPIGGVARLERIPEKPLQELWVAVAGPLVNLVIAGMLWLLLALTQRQPTLDLILTLDGPFAARLLLSNLFLVAFNMLPAFPMDGGRVFRALLALWLPHPKATRWAAWVGRFMAVLFALVALYWNPLLLLIAVFVWVGAGQELRVSETRAALDGVRVADAMLTNFTSLEPHENLERAAREVLAGFQQDFPIAQNGRLLGMLERPQLLRALELHGPLAFVAAHARETTRRLDPEEPLEVAVLNGGVSSTIPVVRDGMLVGLVTPDNVTELLLVKAALEGRALRLGRSTSEAGSVWRRRFGG